MFCNHAAVFLHALGESACGGGVLGDLLVVESAVGEGVDGGELVLRFGIWLRIVSSF